MICRFGGQVLPGYDVSMNEAKYAEGDLVRVTSGIYADAVGVVDDIKPECSVIRIHAKEGTVYADADAVVKMPTEQPKTKALLLKR